MNEALADTGPLLHLSEIDRPACLGIFTRMTLPELVAEELGQYGISIARLATPELAIGVVSVDPAQWQAVIRQGDDPLIQPADAQVLVLARAAQFQTVVLTDDLALRRRLEQHGSPVIGSLGILIRSYTDARLTRPDLEHAVDDLLAKSSLHMSRPFRAYARQLLADLP